jgi:hypothetical protein
MSNPTAKHPDELRVWAHYLNPTRRAELLNWTGLPEDTDVSALTGGQLRDMWECDQD